MCCSMKISFFMCLTLFFDFSNWIIIFIKNIYIFHHYPF